MSDAPYGPGQIFWVLIVLIAAVAFGTAPIFVRELTAVGVEPAAIAFLRYALTALVLLPFLSLRGGKLIATLMGMLAGMVMGFGWIGFVSAVNGTTIAIAGILYLSFPMFTMIFAWALLGEIPGSRGFLAGAMAFVGVAIAINAGVVTDLTMIGVIFALSAPLAFGFAITIQTGWLGRLNPLEQLACVPFGTCLGLAPIAWFNTDGEIIPPTADWLTILAFAVGTSLLPSLVYVIGAGRIGRFRAALAGSVELPAMFIFGVVVFTETIGELEIAAGLLIVCAILVSAVSRQPKGRPPAS